MKNAIDEYKAALADFARPGNRWATVGRVTYWAKAAGLDAERLVEDARAVGVRDRDSDLRRGWESAHPQGANHAAVEWRPRAANKPKGPTPRPHFVRDCIEAGGGEADFDALRKLSPQFFPHSIAPQPAQTAAFLRALFAERDFVYSFRADKPEDGRLGYNLRPCAEWLRLVERGGRMPGDLVAVNPLSGRMGLTKGNVRSLIAASCVAAYRFLVVEFDAMPLAAQCAFWCGCLKSPLAPLVVSIVFSGNKSLHTVLRVGDGTDLAAWEVARDKLKAYFCTDPDPAFRADAQAMLPRQGTRLAGVTRWSTGKRQELLFLRPEAARQGTVGADCSGGGGEPPQK